LRKGRPAKKYSQAARLHDVIRIIEARSGVTVEELAEETGVDKRTVYRDLGVIHEAGYPLVSGWRNGRKEHRFLTGFKDIPPIRFTLQELMTLYFLRSQLDMFRGTPFHEDMEVICQKINSALPPRYAAHMERITEVSVPVLQGTRDYGKVAAELNLLRDALLHQYTVDLGYRAGGRGRSRTYRVDPYTIVLHKGGLYLLGFAHNRRALRTFSLNRITRLAVGKQRFEIPDSFIPAVHLQKAFGIVQEEALPVTVKFSPVVAHSVIERIWHPSQKITKNTDGSVVISLEAGGVMEIVSWVLSYGSNAEVMGPPGLRDQVRKIVTGMEQIYLGAPQ
jgi:proteasome accessory factor B